MKLKKTIQNIMLIATLSVASINADDGKEFNITPSSPLDHDFFNNEIPASYLTSNKDKNAINYAILESGPTKELKEDEIYIEHLYVSSKQKYNSKTRPNNSEDIYPAAAGVFIDDDTTIPENLVSIESIPQPVKTKKTNTKGQTQNSHDAGEFVIDETNAITADPDKRDKYTAFPAGTFSIGYQMIYLNYRERDTTAETIYNGIKAEYSYTFDNNIILKASSSILGGKILNKNYGSLYSDNKLILGTIFRSSDKKFSVTPFLGFGARYMNNVFSTENCIERNTLQLYIPAGIYADYTPTDNYNFFTNIEISPIAFNQNWSTFNTGHSSTSSAFNGVSALIEVGSEFNVNNKFLIGIKPFYQYIYSSTADDSQIGNSNIHMAGINAYIKF